jgi:dimethylargininase
MIAQAIRQRNMQGRGRGTVALACRQWDGYVQALTDFGWGTVEVPPADGCPDGVFVEDTVVVYNVAVIALSGAPGRRAEVTDAAAAVDGRGLSVNRIRGSGTSMAVTNS